MEGDRAGARDHFQKTLDTKIFTHNVYPYARAFLARLKQDATWRPGTSLGEVCLKYMQFTGMARYSLSPNRALVTYRFMYRIEVEERSSPRQILSKAGKANVKDRVNGFCLSLPSVHRRRFGLFAWKERTLVYFATGPCSEFRQSDRVPADFFTLPIGTFQVGFARIF